jgi:tetratricopeptide (TPR) repeat protein
MNTSKLPREGLGDALALSLIQKLFKDPASRQLALGQYLLGQGKLSAAELCFETALRESQGTSVAVEALIGKAEISRRREQFGEAHQALSAAQEIAEKLNDPRVMGLVHWQKAEVVSTEGDLERALKELQEAKEAFTRSKRVLERAQVALKLGLTCQQLLRVREALTYFGEAEQLSQGLIGEAETKGKALQLLAQLGQAYALLGLGRVEEALHLAEEAKLKASCGSDKEWEKLLLELRAGCFEAQGRLAEAMALREKVLALSSGKARIQALGHLASLAFSTGYPQKAREYEAQANGLLKQEEAPEARLILSELGLMRGQIHAAQEHFVHAMMEMGSTWSLDKQRAIALELHQGALDLQQGLFRLALERVSAVYEKLAELQREGRDVEVLITSTCRLLGNLRRLEGTLEEAERLYKEALEIANRSGRHLEEASALSGLASIAAARAELPLALDYLERAIIITQGCGAVLNLKALEVERVSLLERQGELSSGEAIAALENLLDIALHLESLPLELAVRTTLGLFHWRKSHYSLAARYLEEAMEGASRGGLEFTRIVTEGLLGMVLDDLGEKDLAEFHLGKTLEAMERRGLEIEAKEQFQERFRDLGWYF